jgi:hypothetical protein
MYEARRLSKAWPRRGLAVRTSPGGGYRTERLLERAGQCGLGVVADNLGGMHVRIAGKVCDHALAADERREKGGLLHIIGSGEYSK